MTATTDRDQSVSFARRRRRPIAYPRALLTASAPTLPMAMPHQLPGRSMTSPPGGADRGGFGSRWGNFTADNGTAATSRLWARSQHGESGSSRPAGVSPAGACIGRALRAVPTITGS